MVKGSENTNTVITEPPRGPTATNSGSAPGSVAHEHAQEVNISMNAPRLDTFTGTSDFHEFVSQFEIHAAARNWDEATKARWLPTYLRGPALSYYNDKKDELGTFEALKNGLSKNFGKVYDKDLMLQKLYTIRQRDNESVLDYTLKTKTRVSQKPIKVC